jgi:hypothetical protein
MINLNKIGTVVRNKKTGQKYIIQERCINTTNNVDGQKMVVYTSYDKGELFVREESEFQEKFEKLG